MLPLVSIIILNYNGREYLGPCIRDVLRSSYDVFEVIVVDNASTDGSLDLLSDFPAVRVVRNSRNLLSSAGLNRGIQVARGDIVVLLDQDTSVRSDWLEELLRPLIKDPAVAITGSKLLYRDGLVQHAGGAFEWNGFTRHLRSGEVDVPGEDGSPRDVDYVCGASMAIRRSLLTHLGGLDECMPFYFEEVDLCWQAHRLGYKVLYVPNSVVVHHESASIGKNTNRYLFNYHRGRWRFMLKNFELKVLMTEVVPAEMRWLKSADETHARPRVMWRVYLSALVGIPGAVLRRISRRSQRICRPG